MHLNRMPTISIVIPTLNESEYLPKLLGSIKSQTFTDYEVIVADAGSKDGTVEAAEKAGALVVAGGMPGVGRNRGARVANGDIIFFFDADVLLPETFLENAYNEMQAKSIDLATCEFWPQSEYRLDKLMFQFSNLIVKLNAAINPRAAGFCIFVTRRLFRQVGGFDETLKLAEDHDFVERAAKFRPLRVLDSTNMTVSIRRLTKEGRFSLLEKYFQVEWHLLTKGKVREDIVEYEFGNFDNEEAQTAKKALDDFEQRILKMEEQYNQALESLNSGAIADKIEEGKDRLKQGVDDFLESLKGMFKKKDD
jgi:glycosyltransferase involved in cell wall biosynthesis